MQQPQTQNPRAAALSATLDALAPRRIPRALLREAIAPAAFVALILLSNYALASLPNIKLFDLLVFVAGYTLGLRRGATVAVAAWLIYGHINPWGGAHPQLLITLMASETLYAAPGALVRRILPPNHIPLRPGLHSLAFLLPALIATPMYDIATNIYTGYHWALIAGNGEYARWITTALFNPGALFFAAAHLSANLLFFTIFGPPLIRTAERARQTLP